MTQLEVTSLLLKLADLGVTGIAVYYDGSGDSGSIENIVFTRESCATAQDVENQIQDIWSAEGLGGIDTAIKSDIEDYVYHFLEDIEDWYNNDGGFGNMYIHIPSGQYIINNNVRITDVESFEHEGNLMDKTREK